MELKTALPSELYVAGCLHGSPSPSPEKHGATSSTLSAHFDGYMTVLTLFLHFSYVKSMLSITYAYVYVRHISLMLGNVLKTVFCVFCTENVSFKKCIKNIRKIQENPMFLKDKFLLHKCWCFVTLQCVVLLIISS